MHRETEMKKHLVKSLKAKELDSNFEVGSHPENFDKKENATLDHPSFAPTVVSPWPHKNTSIVQLKYPEETSFAHPHPHSKTMDINRMEASNLQLNERPKMMSHLKQTSIKFTQYQQP